MNTNPRTWMVGTATVLAVCAIAAGQNALDANRQVGGTGVNPGPAGRQYWVNSNLIVTGNVTGGLSFQGYSPITAPSQFGFNSLALPSSTLNTFRRDSVSIGQAQTPQTYTVREVPVGSASPYYGTSNTVLNAGEIRLGLNEPGSSAPASPYETLVQPVDGRPEAQRFAQPWQIPTGGNFAFGGLGPANAGQSPAPGSGAADGGAALQWPAAGSRNIDVLEGSPLARILGSGQGASPWPEPTDQQTLAGELTNYAGRDAREDQTAIGTYTMPAGVDTFNDMVNALQFSKNLEDATAAQLARNASNPAGSSRAEDQTNFDAVLKQRLETDPRLQMEGLTPSERLLLERQVRREVQRELEGSVMMAPIDTFAGQKDTMLNRNLRQAEDLMSQHQYHLAVTRYEIAHAIDLANPLPLLGKGHALIGASEFRSAAVALLQGIACFPEIAQFKLDLRTLFGDSEVLDIRRAVLERRLEEADDWQLRFVLGYIEYYSGMTEFGLRDLRKAADDAEADEAVRHFVDLLYKAQPDKPAPSPAR